MTQDFKKLPKISDSLSINGTWRMVQKDYGVY